MWNQSYIAFILCSFTEFNKQQRKKTSEEFVKYSPKYNL